MSSIPSFSIRRFAISAVVVPTLLLSACSHQPPPQAPTAAAPSPAPVAWKPPPQDNLFKVSPAVQAKCNLPDTPTDSPQFDFDDASLRPRGMGILDRSGFF